MSTVIPTDGATGSQIEDAIRETKLGDVKEMAEIKAVDKQRLIRRQNFVKLLAEMKQVPIPTGINCNRDYPLLDSDVEGSVSKVVSGSYWKTATL